MNLNNQIIRICDIYKSDEEVSQVICLLRLRTRKWLNLRCEKKLIHKKSPLSGDVFENANRWGSDHSVSVIRKYVLTLTEHTQTIMHTDWIIKIK